MLLTMLLLKVVTAQSFEIECGAATDAEDIKLKTLSFMSFVCGRHKTECQ